MTGINNKINYQSVNKGAYDGSELNCHIGWDPFDTFSINKSFLTIWIEKKIVAFYSKRTKFRLPRKLKKQVRKYAGKGNLEFAFIVFKTSKYYKCAVKKELDFKKTNNIN